MRVEKAQLRRVAGATPGAGNAGRSWPSRSGLHLELEDGAGRRGWGEASPLPGYSWESLEMAEAELFAWLEHLPRELDGRSGIFAAVAELAAPSARFAAESALFDLLGQERGQPIHQLLGGRTSPVPLQLVHLLPAGGDSGAVLAAAETLANKGMRHFKLKVGGPDFTAELALLAELRRRFGTAVTLRLDANRSLAGSGREAKVAALAACEPELLEEPGGPPDLEAPYPLAFDESLLDPALRAALPKLLRQGDFRVLVLKPMLLGGFEACLELARIAVAAGCATYVTHLFDGPIGLAAASHLALSLPGRVLPCGLARHPGLASWEEVMPPGEPLFIGATQIAAPTSPGLWGER